MRLELPPVLVPLAVAWVAILGAVVGSFLNVVIARVPKGESIAWPGSRCPKCLAPIRWYDNLPIVSWFVLRGRCRACAAPISVRYPLVEALGMGTALVVYGRHGLSGVAAAELGFASALLALAFIDLDTWLLPNTITWSLLAFGILMGPLGVTPATTLRYAVYGAGIGFTAFASLSWIAEKLLKKEALGFGDVWLLAGLGAWFGPAGLLPIVLLASIQGSIVGIGLIAMGKGQPGPEGEGGPPEEHAPLPGPLPASRGEGDDTRGALPASRGGDETHGTPDRRGTSPRPTEADATAGSVVEDEEDWIPPKNSVPFGPFLVAGALEWLWLGDLFVRWIPTLSVFR